MKRFSLMWIFTVLYYVTVKQGKNKWLVKQLSVWKILTSNFHFQTGQMMYRSDDVLLKSFVRRHITIYHIFFLVNVLLILHYDPHLANYFTIFHLYWCWYSFHVKSIPRCQTHQNQHLCLKRMLLFISIFPVLLGYLDGGPNFWRYGLSWSGSTRPYWSSFGWAQVWLALHWRLAKSPNHFVLTSAFVTQCWRWLWQRDEWGIKTQQSQNLNNKCFKKIKLALLCMCQ